jgi:hypothetical protein
MLHWLRAKHVVLFWRVAQICPNDTKNLETLVVEVADVFEQELALLKQKKNETRLVFELGPGKSRQKSTPKIHQMNTWIRNVFLRPKGKKWESIKRVLAAFGRPKDFFIFELIKELNQKRGWQVMYANYEVDHQIAQEVLRHSQSTNSKPSKSHFH